MPEPTEPRREASSAYFVQDRGNFEEMTRLETQDKMLNIGMGGVLPELADPTQLRRVLDVGCGTGGWLLETARTYPTIERLVGGDISNEMIAYASAQTRDQHLDGRVEFQTMDALRILEFPEASFDLVNQRFGASWIRTWEWTKILLEYQRVSRPGGIIRITEPNVVECNSPALTKLYNIGLETFYHSGRLFTASYDGATNQLVRLMTQHAIEDVQTRVHTMVYRAGTPEHQSFCASEARFYRVLLPFFQRWTRVPSDYDEIYEQAMEDMQQPDFVATWRFLTVWGTRHEHANRLLMRGLK